MKRSFLVMALLAFALLAAGQSAFQNRPPLRERLFFGGGFGLTFGSITNIEVSPLVGVRVLPRLAVAGGPTFQYYADEFGEMTIYGGKGYVQFTLIQSLDNLIPLGLNTGVHLHGEYEGLSLDKALVSIDPDATGRVYSGAFLGGVTISQPTGMRSSMNLSFLWVLTSTGYQIYDNPEIRISFVF
ncbi:MAG: hypothetical protein L0Y37_03205 [Bacteroidales bacterium]|nr:hypothetical protein [Bacteroidales bacterium]